MVTEKSGYNAELWRDMLNLDFCLLSHIMVIEKPMDKFNLKIGTSVVRDSGPDIVCLMKKFDLSFLAGVLCGILVPTPSWWTSTISKFLPEGTSKWILFHLLADTITRKQTHAARAHEQGRQLAASGM